MEVSVPVQERQQRAMRLRELSLDRFEETARAQIGSLKEILLLNYNHKKKAEKVQTYMMGVSRDYWNVKLELNEKLKSFLQEHELASGSSTDQGMKKNMQEEIQVRIIGYEHSDKSSLEGVLRGELV
jgi:threonylcarbamoyladenosine tRNA methylthiotransferase MtaB